MKFFFRKSTAEREFILRSGERIRIRQLTPAERLRLLPQPDDIAFCKRMSLGMVEPEISFREAKRILNQDPFRALEIVRAIQQFSAEEDCRKLEEYESMENLAFLKQVQAIEQLRNR